jgi:transposase
MAHVVEVRRARRSAEEWRELVADWSGSGVSQSEFCRRRGLSLVTFGGWKRHFDQNALSSSRSRSPAGANPRLGQPERLRFVEVAHRPPLSGSGLEAALYEVRLANGRAVRVGPGFDPATLRQLLAIADAHGNGEAGEC